MNIPIGFYTVGFSSLISVYRYIGGEKEITGPGNLFGFIGYKGYLWDSGIVCSLVIRISSKGLGTVIGIKRIPRKA